jgi:hypothetical protein
MPKRIHWTFEEAFEEYFFTIVALAVLMTSFNSHQWWFTSQIWELSFQQLKLLHTQSQPSHRKIQKFNFPQGHESSQWSIAQIQKLHPSEVSQPTERMKSSSSHTGMITLQYQQNITTINRSVNASVDRHQKKFILNKIKKILTFFFVPYRK